jgi:hypothetical protein
MPPMALIAPYARVTRSTNRSTPTVAITGYQLQKVTVGKGGYAGLRQAGDVVDLDYPPSFIDRIEDAIPPGPQAPQIRRPVRK